MICFFIIIFCSIHYSSSFIFHSELEKPQCYELDVENCFREAFLSAMHPPIRRRKELGFHHLNATLDKRKSAKNLFLCHDVRRFSACFLYPGCNEHAAAAIASVQYHMVFGKKLPIHVFLAYRGFGKQMCDQACSRDTVFICRRTMTKDEQDDEQSALIEMGTLSTHIAANKDNIGTCERFRNALTKVIRYRIHNCGDVARCTCEDTNSEHTASVCGIQCDQLLHQEQKNALNFSAINRFQLTLLIVCIFQLFNYYQ